MPCSFVIVEAMKHLSEKRNIQLVGSTLTENIDLIKKIFPVDFYTLMSSIKLMNISFLAEIETIC